MRASQREPVNPHPRFRVARNPDPESRLPYLIWLPIEDGLVLKARETWPRGPTESSVHKTRLVGMRAWDCSRT
jgi:hypothetical protein